MERTSWPDERLDSLEVNMNRRFDLIEGELRALRKEMHGEFRALRADFSEMQRMLARIGWTVAAALSTALVGMFATLLVAAL